MSISKQVFQCVSMALLLLATTSTFAFQAEKKSSATATPIVGWLRGETGTLYVTQVEAMELVEIETSRWAETEYAKAGFQSSIEVKITALVMPRGCNTEFSKKPIIGHFHEPVLRARPTHYLVRFSDIAQASNLGGFSLCPGVDPHRISFHLPLASKTTIEGKAPTIFIKNQELKVEFPGTEDAPAQTYRILYSKDQNTLTFETVK